MFKKIARHLPARYQHQFAALLKKSGETNPKGNGEGSENTDASGLNMASKTRFRRRRQQADGPSLEDADPTGGPFPQPPTACEDGSAPKGDAVSVSAISIVDHVRTLLLQLSTNDFENAESIWAGETPDSQGVTEKKKWYERMSAQPAALPGKGQTHMPALLLTALKKQVPLVPQMRQDWATAFKAESAGKKCCVRDATMSKAKCGIFDESESCPPDSRWQRGSALGDLGAVNKAAVGGCCGPNQWKKTSLNSFTGGRCEVIGCLVTDIQPNGLGGEKVLLMGTHFEGTSKALEYMQVCHQWMQGTYLCALRL